jgi:hypothetical protein
MSALIICTLYLQISQFETQTASFAFACSVSRTSQQQAVVREGEVRVGGAAVWLVLKEECLQCFTSKEKAESQWQVSLAKEAAAVRAVELRGEALAIVLVEPVEVEEERESEVEVEQEALKEQDGCCCWGSKQKEKVPRKQTMTTTSKKKVTIVYLYTAVYCVLCVGGRMGCRLRH